MRIILLMAILIAAGCGSQVSNKTSSYPMISSDFGKGPWQLITYSGDKIYYEEVEFINKQIHVSSKSVYISNRSQFVYKDGTPIKTYKGNYLYWNKQGYVINKDLEIIPEDLLFIVNESPMPRNTPMKLRNYDPKEAMQASNG